MDHIQLVNTIKNHFSSIKDPRTKNANLCHKLSEIMILILLGVICGADGWVQVEEFGKSRIEFLKTFLTLENGIPSHDTLGDVFSRLNPLEFESCFSSWVNSLATISEDRIIPIDGKALRGSKSLGKSAITMVSAWCRTNQLVLGQRKVDGKSNEITAIPLLLKALDIKGCTVTIDAMGCQRKIANQIVDQGGDYVFGLKGNQGTLQAKVQECFNYAESKNYNEIVHATSKVIEKDHGRIETRECHVLPLMYAPLLKIKWKGLQSLIKIKSLIEKNGKSYLETRYYISSLKANAEKIANTIREHWGVENELHWCLDVGFNEDHCRVRKGNAAQNLAIIRHYALNMLKKERTSKVGIKTKRNKAGWSNDYLIKVLMAGQF